MIELKLKLFEDCKVVKGHCRSAIYDLGRQTYHFIPNSLADLLIKHNGSSVSTIKHLYDNQYDEVIDEYVSFLKENEFAFYTLNPELFPPLKTEWHSNSIITNTIICDNNSNHNYDYLFEILEEFNCRALQFRFFSHITKQRLLEILQKTVKSRIKDIEIIMKYDSSFEMSDFLEFVKINPRITSFYIHSSNFNDIFFLDKSKTLPLFHSSQVITDNSFCGSIHPKNFKINTKFFCESISFNNCLNRKLTIDTNGNVKNCPSMKVCFGNLKSKNLNEVVNIDSFKKLWGLNKEKIKICKDCEFRFMCLDCRAYISDKAQTLSQPAKCSYNPYIAKWNGQEGYVSVEEWLINNQHE